MDKKELENEITFYNSPDGRVTVEVLYAEENIWLTQKKMAELFETTPQNITLHLKHIYEENELEKKSTCKDYLQVQNEGSRKVSRSLTYYSLDAIIAVGYRVKSERGTQFRQWATSILQKYIHKGYVLDNYRFKYGSKFSTRFFDDLLEEIRDIRSSERMAYQKITDIYATSVDYSPKTELSKQFFATVQNKLHFAITGKTAAEIIKDRADSTKPHMGLTSWRKGPDGKILQSDVIIAKNYLNKGELDYLNRIVSMYLDYAEMQAIKKQPMYMKDWVKKLDAFLKFNEVEILTNAGKVTHEVAESLAIVEFKKYKIIQDKNYVSDFDKEIEEIKRITKKDKE